MTELDKATQNAVAARSDLSFQILNSRDPFGFHAFDSDSANNLMGKFEDFIEARLRERDEAWIDMLQKALGGNAE